jgi:anaerobic selenocysteine-containing dehydrogenase
MRILLFDQFEFKSSASEENLRIVIDTVSTKTTPHADVEAFLKAAWNDKNVPALPKSDFFEREWACGSGCTPFAEFYGHNGATRLALLRFCE